jgi:hypothetical protein
VLHELRKNGVKCRRFRRAADSVSTLRRRAPAET